MNDDKAAMDYDGAEDGSRLSQLSQEMSQLAMPDRTILDPPKDAIVLHDFAGEPSYGELTLHAGDRVRVFCEDMTGGWSLAMLVLDDERLNDEADHILSSDNRASRITKGLLPQGFYRYETQDLRIVAADDAQPERNASSPRLRIDVESTGDGDQQASNGVSTPLRPTLATEVSADLDESPRFETGPLRAVARNPRLRQVSAGSMWSRTKSAVELYLDEPSIWEALPTALRTADTIAPIKHMVEDGKWQSPMSSCKVSVPTYETRTESSPSAGQEKWTDFVIRSEVSASIETASASSNSSTSPLSTSASTVHRRYSHFCRLIVCLRREFPLMTIPDLPEARATGRFDTAFVQTRRSDLERWLRRVVRHPLALQSEVLAAFLQESSDTTFTAMLQMAYADGAQDPPDAFFHGVGHNGDYFDEYQLLEDGKEELASLSKHFSALDRGQGLHLLASALLAYRKKANEASHSLQSFAHALLRHNSGLAQPDGIPAGVSADSEPHDDTARIRQRAHTHGLSNAEGALCWREACDTCLSSTKAIQVAAEAWSAVARLDMISATQALAPVQDMLQELQQSHARYTKLFAYQKLVQDRLRSALQQRVDGTLLDEKLVSRCETVLNAVSAEVDYVHRERSEDLRKVATAMLDAHIAFHEHSLAQLRSARASFSSPTFENLARLGPRVPSKQEQSALKPQGLRPVPSTSGYGSASVAKTLQPTVMLSSMLTGAAGTLFGWRSASIAIAAQGMAANDQVAHNSIGSPQMAMSRFVQFLDWSVNSRGEERKHLR